MEHLREKLENVNSVALLLGKSYQENDLLAREALGLAFNLKGTAVHFLPETPKDFKDKWGPILSAENKNHDLDYRTLIRVPKNNIGISEVTYDEDEQFLVFNIKSSGKLPEKEHVGFEANPAVIDTAFCFGTGINGDFDHFIDKEKIIHLIHENKTTAENVFSVIQMVKDKPLVSTPIPTIMLASIFTETNNLRKKTSPELLVLAGNLLEFGANKKIIREIISRSQPQSYPQLLGRALARTQNNDALKSTWTFISPHDLEKTGNMDAGPEIFYQITTSIRDFMQENPIFAILWQKEESVFGLLTMENEYAHAIQNLPENLLGEIKNNFFLTGPYKNFSEAEIKIQEALKKII